MTTTAPEQRTAISRNYTIYLILIALAGWSLASYDFNLLVLTLPDITKDFKLSATQVGALGIYVYIAQFIIGMVIGYVMDSKGRKRMWVFSLSAAAVFTGLTYFVDGYWQLALVRALASGFAMAELAISITLVNEQVPAARRGLLYSIVQGGWPLGVFLASGVYILVGDEGWRMVFLWGVAPLLAVMVGRIWIKESEQYQNLDLLRKAVAAGDTTRIEEISARTGLAAEDVAKNRIRELFAERGPVRRNLVRISVVWILYAIGFVATNVYITWWLTTQRGWSADGAATLLLVCGGLGFGFYVIGGYIGERIGRRAVLVVSGALVGPLNLLLLLVHSNVPVVIVYFLVYQVTNGTWSGAGYAYWAECFPTHVRGTAVGWLSGLFTVGLLLGGLLWTALVGTVGATTTWVCVAVVIGCAQGVSTLILPKVRPGQELDHVDILLEGS